MSPHYTIFESTVAPAIAGLNVLAHLLDVLEAHASQTSCQADQYLTARLAPDMQPLSFQVFLACKATTLIVSSLTDIEPVAFPESSESLRTIDDLRYLIQGALEVAKRTEASNLSSKTNEIVTFPINGQEGRLRAKDCAIGFFSPNVYFHVAMAYAILRKEEVQIGKKDYISPFLASFTLEKK